MTDASSTSAAAPSRKQRLIETAVVMAITLALDLWSKAWAWENLRDPSVKKEIIKDWFEFEFGFNTGAAFSFLRDASYARVVFIGVTILALIYMARLAWTMPTKFRTAFIAVALVAGGALGNLHDRLVRQLDISGTGELKYGVVDFIKVHYWEGKIWPTFNIADVALVLGVGLLFIFLTRHGDALDGKKADDADKKAVDADKKAVDADKKSDDADKKSDDADEKAEKAEKSEKSEKSDDDADEKSEKSDDADETSDDADKKSDDADEKSDEKKPDAAAADA